MLTARVSPTASPGRRSPPGAGSVADRSTNAVRVSAAIASGQGGPRSTSTPRDANTRSTLRRGGSVRLLVPDARTVLPRSSVSPARVVTAAGSTVIVTGTRNGVAREPTSICHASASNRSAPCFVTSTFDVTCASIATARPPASPMASRPVRSPCANATWEAVTAASAMQAADSASAARQRPLPRPRPRRTLNHRTSPVAHQSPIATPSAATGTLIERNAEAHDTTANGTSRRSRLIRTPAHGSSQGSSHQCRARQAGLRCW